MNNSATNIIDDLRFLEPWTAPPPWVWLSLVILIVVVAALLRRRRRPATLSQNVAVYAQEDALAELEKARSLLAPENSRPYGIEVSNIVRRYIERRFGLLAPRRSTEEFLTEAASSAKLQPEYRTLLAEFLSCCDALKFGRALAEVPELEAQHTAAVRFVTETRA